VKQQKLRFRQPFPPGSVVRAKASPSSSWRKNVGRRFRIGYYGKADGLDCIGLVNEKGEYEQTIDHKYLRKYFEIESISNERSLYGKDRPAFGRMT
jgi:predicted oxidoreductase